MWLDSEDSLSVRDRPGIPSAPGAGSASPWCGFPRISNFTDIDALCLEPGVDVSFVADPGALAGADVVVLPGTRATMADLAWLRATRARLGGSSPRSGRAASVLGICGGFQMLGREIADPDGVEGERGGAVPGSGCSTRDHVRADKVLGTPGRDGAGRPVAGYEIHHGRVDVGAGEQFPGGGRSGAVFGTMWHGCLEGDPFRRAWLALAAELAGVTGFERGRTVVRRRA